MNRSDIEWPNHDEIINTIKSSSDEMIGTFQPITWNELDVKNKYVIRMFGVSESGLPVCLDINGFNPYFYVKGPLLRTAIKTQNTIVDRFMIKGYNPNPVKMTKLEFSNLSNYRMLYKKYRSINDGQTELYGAHVNPFIYMFHNHNIDPMSILVVKNIRQLRDTRHINGKHMLCEVSDISSIKGKFMSFLRMAYDIETYSIDRKFPSSKIKENDVIQIAATFDLDTPFNFPMNTIKFLLTIQPNDGIPIEIPGVNVLEYVNENKLLLGFALLIRNMNPDMIYGYNSQMFDWPYILDRVSRYGKQFYKLFMKLLGRVGTATIKEISSGNATRRDNLMYPDMNGRLDIDILSAVRRMDASNYGKKLESYTLNNVSQIYLHDSKEDMPYQTMFDLYELGESAGFKDIGTYCIQDTELCHKLYRHFDLTSRDFLMASVAIVPLEYIYFRKEQVKVISHLEKLLMEKDIQMRNVKYVKNDTFLSPPGGYVGTAISGKYRNVTVLDFSSLYPTVMIGHNISPDTLVKTRTVYYYLPDEIRNKGGSLRPEMLGLPEDIEKFEKMDVVDEDYGIDPSELDGLHLYTVKFVSIYKRRGIKPGKTMKDVLAIVVSTNTFVDAINPYSPDNSNGVTGILCEMEYRLLAARKEIKKQGWAIGSKKKKNLDKLRKLGVNSDMMKEGLVLHSMESVVSELNNPEISKIAHEYDELYSEGTRVKLVEMAYKVMANSVYGQTVSDFSPLYDINVGGSITTTGKNLIKWTERIVEEQYPGSNVMYGDTDSVFINMDNLFINIINNTFDSVDPDVISNLTKYRNQLKQIILGNSTINKNITINDIENLYHGLINSDIESNRRLRKTALELNKMSKSEHNNRLTELREVTKLIGEEMAKLCTDIFNRPTINLDFEKILDPFYLFVKKHYFGGYYDIDMSTPSQILIKGLNMKRRGTVKFYVDTYSKMTQLAVNNREDEIYEYFANRYSNLLNYRVPLDDITMTTRIKALSEYKESTLTRKPEVILMKRISDRTSERNLLSMGRLKFAYTNTPMEFDKMGRWINSKLGYRIETIEFINQNKLNVDTLLLFTSKFQSELISFAICSNDVKLYRLSIGVEKMYKKFISRIKAIVKILRKQGRFGDKGIVHIHWKLINFIPTVLSVN